MDGDTSTNDTVIGLAGGAAGNKLISEPSSKEAEQLHAVVTALLQVQCSGKYAISAAGTPVLHCARHSASHLHSNSSSMR